jgi:hypothetical protein
LSVVGHAYSNIFEDMAALMRHAAKKQWFGPKDDLAVQHNKQLFVLGVDATDANRYELKTALSLLEYLLRPERIEATRAVILFHENNNKYVPRQFPPH